MLSLLDSEEAGSQWTERIGVISFGLSVAIANNVDTEAAYGNDEQERIIFEQEGTSWRWAPSRSREARFAWDSQLASGTNPREALVEAVLGQRLVIACANLTNEPPAPILASATSRKRPRPSQSQSHRITTGGSTERLASNGHGISLIVWHKDDQVESPVFSADARKANLLREAKQQANDQLRDRAHLEETNGGRPALVINQAEESDAGTYRCTVEFFNAATQSFQMRVILIKPPRNMIIRDDSGQQLKASGILGPYDEDSQVELTCEVESEDKQANIGWWQLRNVQQATRQLSFLAGEGQQNNNYLLSLTLEEPGSGRQNEQIARDFFLGYSSPSLGLSLDQQDLPTNRDAAHRLKQWIKVPNQNVIPTSEFKFQTSIQLSLARSNLADEYLCLANNQLNSVPLNLTAKINLNLKPLEVKIVNKSSESNMILAKKHTLECQVSGSKPSPTIRWFRGAQELLPRVNSDANHIFPNENANYVISELNRDTNSTRLSYLTLTPQLSDNQESLTCTAENPKMANKHLISDSITMNVQFPAQMSLEFGAAIDPESIRLKQDVFMECHVKANPPIEELNWLFNDKPLAQNSTAGVIMSNQTLVLQQIKIDSRGSYQCVGRNSMGKSHSNKLQLRPKFEPVCDYSSTKTRHELSVNQLARVECNVLAEPNNDLQFSWKFKQNLDNPDFPAGELVSSGHVEEIKQFETNFSKSYVNFTPKFRRNYGQLECLASNSEGRQEKPCIIKIVPSELPDPVFGCFTDNSTSSSFNIHCQTPSLSDRESYILELYTNESSTMISSQIYTSTTSETTPKQRQQQRQNQQASDYEEFEEQEEHDLFSNNSQLVSKQLINMQDSQREVKTVTSKRPSFHLSDLQPDTSYNVLIYVKNAKGRSQPFSYQVTTMPGNSNKSLVEGRIEIGNSRRASGSGSDKNGGLSDKLISYLRVGDSSKPMISIALGVVLISMLVFMLIYSVSCLCNSLRRRRTSNPAQNRQQEVDCKLEEEQLRKSSSNWAASVNCKKNSVRDKSNGGSNSESDSSRAKEEEEDDDDNEVDELASDRLASSRQEQFEKSRLNVKNSLMYQAPNGASLPMRLKGLAGSGSDTSHETNTDSTLISSAQTNFPPSNDTNSSRQLRFAVRPQTTLHEIDTFTIGSSSGISGCTSGRKNLTALSSNTSQPRNSSAALYTPPSLILSTYNSNSNNNNNNNNQNGSANNSLCSLNRADNKNPSGVIYSTVRRSNNALNSSLELTHLPANTYNSSQPVSSSNQTGSDCTQASNNEFLYPDDSGAQEILLTPSNCHDEPLYVISRNGTQTGYPPSHSQIQLLDPATLWTTPTPYVNDQGLNQQQIEHLEAPQFANHQTVAGFQPGLLHNSSSIPVALSDYICVDGRHRQVCQQLIADNLRIPNASAYLASHNLEKNRNCCNQLDHQVTSFVGDEQIMNTISPPTKFASPNNFTSLQRPASNETPNTSFYQFHKSSLINNSQQQLYKQTEVDQIKVARARRSDSANGF